MYVPRGPPSWTLQLHTCVPKQPSPPSAHPTQSTADTYHEFMMYMLQCSCMHVPVTHVLGNSISPSPEFEPTLGLSAVSVEPTKDNDLTSNSNNREIKWWEGLGMWLAIFSCDCFNSVWLYNYIVLLIVYHSQSGMPTCKLFIWDCVAAHLCSKAAFSSVSLSFSRVTEVRIDCWIVTWVCESTKCLSVHSS